jgi:hypothetical protein
MMRGYDFSKKVSGLKNTTEKKNPMTAKKNRVSNSL